MCKQKGNFLLSPSLPLKSVNGELFLYNGEERVPNGWLMLKNNSFWLGALGFFHECRENFPMWTLDCTSLSAGSGPSAPDCWQLLPPPLGTSLPIPYPWFHSTRRNPFTLLSETQNFTPKSKHLWLPLAVVERSLVPDTTIFLHSNAT